jgi:hypothetical protein
MLKKLEKVDYLNNKVSGVAQTSHVCVSGRSWKKIGDVLTNAALVICAVAFAVLFMALGALNLHLTAQFNIRHGFFLGRPYMPF